MIKKILLVTFIFMNVLLIAASPILSNFRVEDSQKNRVYFDSDTSITGTSINGFIINGKTVTAITIVDGQTTGHYFTVSSPFNFWDNNTIRYEGGGNIQSTDAIVLSEFTLSYIKNNIPEPNALEYRYVTNAAKGGGDGLSEGSAWTFQEGLNNANPGQTVWIKAGNYGNLNLNMSNKNGTVSNPIKFIGYKTSVGDITNNYFDNYPTTWSASEMPTLTGISAISGIGIYLSASNFVVFRNIQITNYAAGIKTPSKNNWNSNVIIDNSNFKEFGATGFNSGVGLAIYTYNSGVTRYVGNTNFKITNCIVNNYSMGAVHVLGDGTNLIKNVKTYNDFTERADYQITISGDNNIITNCRVENVDNTDNRSTHGIGVRGDIRRDSDYNLIEKSTAVNLNEGFYIRNFGCDYNVIKDCIVKNNDAPLAGTNGAYRGGVSIWGGVNNNIVERVTVNDAVFGIGFKDNEGEDGIFDKTIGSNNIVRNCTFNNVTTAIGVGAVLSGGKSTLIDNKIINCSFNNIRILFSFYNVTVTNLEIINCTFSNVQYEATSIGYPNYFLPDYDEVHFDHSNFWNFGFSIPPTATNSIQVDPKFIDSAAGNFRLKPESELVDNGIITNYVNFDFEGKSRLSGATHDIGAFEYQSSFTGSVSSDISICNGENTVLSASGGTSYTWNTGDTTASITVNPLTTTTYSVTIIDNNGTSKTLNVVVTVDEAPSVDLGPDQSICYGESITLNATGTGDFLWSTGETTASIDVTPTTTTTYTVTASNSCVTDATDDIIVNVNPEIGLTVGNDVSICVGESTTLTATGNGDFLWNTGETTPSITVQPNSTTSYTVTSTLGTCTENATILVTVSEAPSVNLGSDQSICYGETVTLTATGTGDFLWNTGETTASITVNPVTTTTYTVTASISCATDVTDDIIVNVNPEIGLTVGNDISICVGESTTLTATGNGDFLWNTGETTSSITVQPNSTTTYSVSSSIGACTENANILVTVNQPPSVDLGSDQSICYGETVILTATGSGDFLWSTGETTESINVNPTTTTTYTVTASNACSDAVEDAVIINVNPEIGLTVGNNISICTGESTTLTATGNGDFLWNTGESTPSITVQPNSTTTYTVTSSLGSCTENASVIVTVSDSSSVDLGEDRTICNGESITLTATGSGNFLWSTGETTSSITVNPTTTTTYSITASNSCSGDATDDIIINVNELPSVNAGEDITILYGESTILTATGNGNFLWSTGETSPSITVNPTSSTTYSVVITSDQGCLNQDTVLVTVENPVSIVADAGQDQTVCPDSSDTVLTASGGDTYLWSTGETTASITVSPTETTVYTVAVYVGNTHTFDDVTVYIDESCTNNTSSVKQEFKLYPNPSNGVVNIEMSGINGDLNISLFNLNGSVIHTENMNNSSKEKVLKRQLNLSRFAKGMYIVRISNGGSVVTKKLMVI